MTLLALSFHGKHLNALRFAWVEQQFRQQMHDTDTRQPPSSPAFQGVPWQREHAMGGIFAVFDWERNEVVWQITIDGVAGFCFHDQLLYLNMMRLDEVIALDGTGHEQQRFSHPHLNNIHTILPGKRGFLLASSGTDSIIELDRQGNLLYEWCALDHGYSLLPNGQKRLLDRSLDQRHYFYNTRIHSTHVNSARFLDTQETSILATLFHQGQVIEIEKCSGEARTLVSGLDRPHDLRPYREGWVLSNTGAGQTLVLNADWQIVQSLNMDLDWVQSSAPLHDDSLVIADTNHYRLVRAYINNQGEIYHSEERSFPTDWRIYQVEEVPEEYSNFFQHPIVNSPL